MNSIEGPRVSGAIELVMDSKILYRNKMCVWTLMSEIIFVKQIIRLLGDHGQNLWRADFIIHMVDEKLGTL